MVATSNPLASQAGLAVLRAGGNAADAAIAAAAVLNVTESASTGIGGDCFALFYDATTKSVSALNGSGRAPAALSAAHLRGQGWTAIPPRSVHAITVPGAVAGWYDLIEQHGTLPMSTILADAIQYARDGFPVHPLYGAAWRRSATFLKNSLHTEDYLPDNDAPEIGDVVRLPGLARTLQAIAEGGRAAFYEGATADAIIETIQSLGGVMSHDDLRNHTSTWQQPIAVDYRGVRVYECPPNGQGLAALQALNILNEIALGELEWHDPRRIHNMVEAMRLAFADARQYIADDDTNRAPLDFLLSDAYAAERRALIEPEHAMTPPSFGAPMGGSNTVYLSVVDGEGNACSFINSLYMGFGTGIVARGTGVFLQNRGACFSLVSGHADELAPGKRPYHTIIPAMATHDGDLWGSFGVMGGFMQPQGHVQVLSAMIDDGLAPQAALDRPRWCLDGMDIPQAGTSDDAVILALEYGIPMETMARLADYGHRVRPVSRYLRGMFGDGQIIRRDAKTGVLSGGSDPRKDGQTAAF